MAAYGLLGLTGRVVKVFGAGGAGFSTLDSTGADSGDVVVAFPVDATGFVPRSETRTALPHITGNTECNYTNAIIGFY